MFNKVSPTIKRAALYFSASFFTPAVCLAATREYPWVKLLTNFKDHLVGPLAIILGIIAIAWTAMGFLQGHSGDGMRRLLMVIIAIGIIFFAPILVEMIQESASGG